MAEYIKKEEAKKLIKNYRKGSIEDGKKVLDPVDDIVDLAKAIDFIPAADVVEVVRCKDCKHQENCLQQVTFYERDHVLEQNINRHYRLEYCGYGERRGDDVKGNA